MQWLEIISLRSGAKNKDVLEQKLRQLCGALERENRKTAVAYSRDQIDSDYCIHLRHQMEDVERGGSSLGLRLVEALKEFGLVHHSVWKEMD